MNMRKDGNCKMGKKLTVYFSASGVTRKAAEKVAKEHDTDLFEIRPVELYSDADLNWNNKNSRSSREMGDKSSRVEIADKMDNMADYDEIYLGFPIWWGVAPHIINSFLESYDMAGKTIFPFATSGGSGYGRSNEELKASAPDAKWNPGKMVR